MKVKDKYKGLRVALIAKGTTLKRWAESRDYPLSTVYDAAKGNRGGIKAVKILRELEAFTR
jgi:hypothetical protein